jgi:hypothetical protein
MALRGGGVMTEPVGYKIEFIAGGVVKDADGNIIDDSSERAAIAKLAALGIENLLEKEDGS